MRRETAITFSSHSSVLPARQALTLPSIFHPLPPLSASLSPTTSRNPHPPSLSHLRLSPFHPFVAVLSFPYITPLFLVSPLHQTCPHFSPPHPPQLPSPLFLIISTLRLPLAAFSLSASALLSLSFGPGSLPIPRSSAHLSLFRLRPAWTDTLPGKQSKAKWTKGRRRVKESMKAEKWQRKSRDRDKKTCKIRRKKNWILEVLIFNHSYDLYGFIFIFKRCV